MLDCFPDISESSFQLCPQYFCWLRSTSGDEQRVQRKKEKVFVSLPHLNERLCHVPPGFKQQEYTASSSTWAPVMVRDIIFPDLEPEKRPGTSEGLLLVACIIILILFPGFSWTHQGRLLSPMFPLLNLQDRVTVPPRATNSVSFMVCSCWTLGPEREQGRE